MVSDGFYKNHEVRHRSQNPKNADGVTTSIDIMQSNTNINICISKRPFYIKGKAFLLQAWIGPEGSRKLRFPYFMTTAKDGGKVVSLTHRPPLPPVNTPGTHFC
jgi:hypothetical protein